MGKKKNKRDAFEAMSFDIDKKYVQHLMALTDLLAQCYVNNSPIKGTLIVTDGRMMKLCPLNASDMDLAKIVGEAHEIITMQHIGSMPPKEMLN